MTFAKIVRNAKNPLWSDMVYARLKQALPTMAQNNFSQNLLYKIKVGTIPTIPKITPIAMAPPLLLEFANNATKQAIARKYTNKEAKKFKKLKSEKLDSININKK